MAVAGAPKLPAGSFKVTLKVSVPSASVETSTPLTDCAVAEMVPLPLTVVPVESATV